MTTDLEHLLNKVTIGVGAKAFLDSDIGRYLQERGQKEIDGFRTEVQKIGVPHEETEILRMEIKARLAMFEWMVEAMNEADNADLILTQGEQED